jgi:hypothetical protein
MPYTPTVWTDEVPATTPVKYKITDDTSGVLANSAKIEVVTSITPGTSVCAANLNKLEEGVEDAQAAAEAAQADIDALKFPLANKNASGISTDTSSTDYSTVANSTVSLTLATTCHLIAMFSGVVTSSAGDEEYIKMFVDGTEQPEMIIKLAAGDVLPVSIVGAKLNVSSGSRSVYLQFKSYGGNQVNLYNGTITLLAIPVIS